MKNKQKIIGSIGIFFILVICMFFGYKMSKPKEVNMKEMFTEKKDLLNTNKDSKEVNSNEKNQNEESKENQESKNNETKKIVSINESEKEKKKDSKESDTIKVCIAGSVKNPDMYTLKKDSRIKNLLQVSGGAVKEADLSSINLAQKLKDEDYIYIPKKGESSVKKEENNKNQVLKSASLSGNSLNKNSKTESSSKTGKIDINTANKTELMTIPGIGDKKADRIIAYREENGNYKSIEELKQIGARIGEKTLEKMKDYIYVK